VTAPSVPITRSSIEVDQISAYEGLSLLLDLFEPEPSAEASASARRLVGSHRAELRVRVQGWVRGAAGWGAGPEGVRRAW
jgi:hypothetical protein